MQGGRFDFLDVLIGIGLARFFVEGVRLSCGMVWFGFSAGRFVFRKGIAPICLGFVYVWFGLIFCLGRRFGFVKALSGFGFGCLFSGCGVDGVSSGSGYGVGWAALGSLSV